MIVFSIVTCTGCKTFPSTRSDKSAVEWIVPATPKKKRVHSIPIYKNKTFTPSTNGIFLDEDSAKNLMFNIDELDAYIEKQQLLIKEMKEFYKTK